jgi:outer membrane lipoprotein SlyB
MKKYIPFLVIIALISMIMGCATSFKEMKQTLSTHATVVGTGAGTIAGAGLGYAVGGEGGAMLGALIGAAIGGALGYQFTKQDEKNIDTVLEKPPNQKYSWCSNSAHIVTDNDIGRCSSKSQKIMMTAQETQTTPTTQGQRQCRDIQIEIMDSNGDIKSDNQKLCQGNDGKWHSA